MDAVDFLKVLNNRRYLQLPRMATGPPLRAVNQSRGNRDDG
jgi:hypothetical protein